MSEKPNPLVADLMANTPADAAAPKKSKGRPKGALNRFTKDMREQIMAALQKAGGKKYLLKQAKENPVAFMALLGKCLPKDVKVDGSMTYTLEQLINDSAKKPADGDDRPTQVSH